MDPRGAIATVGGLGLIAVVLGVAEPPGVPVPVGAYWLFVAVGFLYVASAVAAWVLVETSDDSFAIALAPAVLVPVVTLLLFAGGDLVAVLTPVPRLLTLSLVAIVFGMAASFPLGAATRARQQWALVAALGLAAVPLVAAALSALTPGPPEDRDLVVLVGMAVLTVAAVPAIPTYALGRSVRGEVAGADADPSPYPPLVAAAMPFVLVLAGLAAAPYFARGTIFGPWLVVVPALALLAVLAQFLRVRARSH